MNPNRATDEAVLRERFIKDGFVRIEGGFSSELAARARGTLWADLEEKRDDPTTWRRPVVRLGNYTEPLFREAANTAALRTAIDALVGQNRWLPCGSMGTFPVRFPHPDEPGDDGWHIDASFMLPEDDPGNFMHWRVNVTSRDRCLLMLFLFSDVGESDAPTRIRVGSHADIARALQPAGDKGMRLGELVDDGVLADRGERAEALATGNAGTVYLCHPFLAHAAQKHRGREPRFMAQPPLLPREQVRISGRADGEYSAVEEAIRIALA